LNLPIYLRNVPPPLETFNHPEFLQFLISYIKPVVYLELGVSTGITFSLCAKYSTKAICVDINPCTFNMTDNMEYHQETTDDFFSSLDQNVIFDAVFIDADHSHEQSLKDFLNVKDRVVEDGFIFIHDTYPYNEIMMDPHYCNDSYKTAHYLKNNFIDDFEILTLPFNPGLTIIKKMKREKQLIYQH
jgi:predicted O-methyltransferase YrrM